MSETTLLNKWKEAKRLFDEMHRAYVFDLPIAFKKAAKELGNYIDQQCQKGEGGRPMNEKFTGYINTEAIYIKNKPAYLDIIELHIELHMDGNILILTGQTHRGGTTKDVVWVYKRIRG